MKTLLLNLTIAVFLITTLSCNSVNGKEEKKESSVSTENTKIEVYYFHYTRRCATCMAVENETKAAIDQYYASEEKNGTITFESINLDEPSSEVLAQKYEISGQTLLVISGDKKEDLTTDAFMNANSNPEKFRELIKSTIDPLVKK